MNCQFYIVRQENSRCFVRWYSDILRKKTIFSGLHRIQQKRKLLLEIATFNA